MTLKRQVRYAAQWLLTVLAEKDIRNVYLQTEGNPFFIRQLLNAGLPVKDGKGIISNNPFVSVIEFSGKDERLFLEALAVEPDHASMLNISKVLDISPLQLSKICENIKNNALVKEKNNDEGDVIYYFTHVKIREALLANMSATRKQALHLKNIEVLEAGISPYQYRKREIYSLLCFHSHEAGLEEKELYWRVMELKQHFKAAHEVFPTLADHDLMKYVPTLEDLDYTPDGSRRGRQTNGQDRAGLRQEARDDADRRDLLIPSGRYAMVERKIRGRGRRPEGRS